MDISRWGAQRNRGTRDIISGLSFRSGSTHRWLDNISWDTRAKCLIIHDSWVAHTDERTHHHYEIRLSLEDIATLLEIVGHAGAAADASLLRDHLKKHIPALVKLLACATGLLPTEMAQAEE
jgi:hypothetical protein